jgi:hypothetical protein
MPWTGPWCGGSARRLMRATGRDDVTALPYGINTVSHHWLWLTAFVGFNLLQSAFTGFCPAERVLRRMGVGRGGAGC